MFDNPFTFSELNPDITLNALESIGILPESGLLALNSYENRVYQFQDENQQRWVAKFYRPNRWKNEQILEEHQFSFKLKEADIPIITPHAIEGESLFFYQDFRFAIFPFMGGRSFEVDNENQLEEVARLLGKMHSIGQGLQFKHRPTISLNEYLTKPRAVLAQCPLIAKHLKLNFLTTLDQLIEKTSAQWSQDWQNIALHGDCHPSNILWRDQPLLVDLDDARNGPAIQDIWMLLSGDRKDQLYQLDIIAEAYSEYADFPISQLKLIEALRSLRIVHYMAWIASRWQDSAFPQAFPWFAEEKYWEEQILVMRKQIELIEQPPLSLYPQW